MRPRVGDRVGIDALRATLDVYLDVVSRRPQNIRAYYALLREADGPVPGGPRSHREDPSRRTRRHHRWLADGQRLDLVRRRRRSPRRGGGVPRRPARRDHPVVARPRAVDIVAALTQYGATLDRTLGVSVMNEHELIIRGGSVVDGTGGPARTADVAIDGDGHRRGRHRRRPRSPRDRRRRRPGHTGFRRHPHPLRRPGGVGLERLAPSSWHGVTTVVMSNCGVGFAPVRAEDRDRLIELMEGVEDIPGTALHEGITWEWESFPGVPRRARASPFRRRCGGADAARCIASVRDG